MTPITLLFLAVSMSADAFAASLSKGAELQKPRFRHAIGIGLVFGVIEAITPVLGWAAGKASQQYVQAWDHWVAFTLLSIIGLHMMYAGLKKDDKIEQRKQTLWLLVLTATATSIDPALFTRALIERSEGTGCWHCLSGFASSARVAVE